MGEENVGTEVGFLLFARQKDGYHFGDNFTLKCTVFTQNELSYATVIDSDSLPSLSSPCV